MSLSVEQQSNLHNEIAVWKLCHPFIHIFKYHSSPSTDGINLNIFGLHLDTTILINIFVECTLIFSLGTPAPMSIVQSTRTPSLPGIEEPLSPSLRDSEETPFTMCM